MKIKLEILKTNNCGKLILFGTRFNYLKVNWGNNTGIAIEKCEFDDEYIEKIGDVPDSYSSYSAFLMDCSKYDFRIIYINGERPKAKIKDTDEYIEVDLNPYSDIYEMEIIELKTTIDIELVFEKDVLL